MFVKWNDDLLSGWSSFDEIEIMNSLGKLSIDMQKIEDLTELSILLQINEQHPSSMFSQPSPECMDQDVLIWDANLVPWREQKKFRSSDTYLHWFEDNDKTNPNKSKLIISGSWDICFVLWRITRFQWRLPSYMQNDPIMKERWCLFRISKAIRESHRFLRWWYLMIFVSW